MTITIRNINPAYGDIVSFDGTTLADAIADMAATISACGPDYSVTPADLADGRDYQIVVPNGYVRTADGTILVQLADNSQHGFSLYDDEQSWPSGFGIAREWTLIPASEVSAEDQARLGWIVRD